MPVVLMMEEVHLLDLVQTPHLVEVDPVMVVVLVLSVLRCRVVVELA